MATKNKKVNTQKLSSKKSYVDYLKSIPSNTDLTVYAEEFHQKKLDRETIDIIFRFRQIAIEETTLKFKREKTSKARTSSNIGKWIACLQKMDFTEDGFIIDDRFLDFKFSDSSIKKFSGTDFKFDYGSIGTWLLCFNLKLTSKKTRDGRYHFLELLTDKEVEETLLFLSEKKQFRQVLERDEKRKPIKWQDPSIALKDLISKYKKEFSHEILKKDSEIGELISIADHIQLLRDNWK
jgi:hypothetical protein